MNYLYPIISSSTHKIISFVGISTEYPATKNFQQKKDFNLEPFSTGVEVILIRENIGYNSLWSHVKCINKDFENESFYQKDIYVLTANLQNIGNKEQYTVVHSRDSSIDPKAREIDPNLKEIFVPYIDKKNGFLSVRIQLDYDKIIDLAFFRNVLETAFYSGAKILLGHMGKGIVDDQYVYDLQQKYYTFGYINNDLDVTINRPCEPLTLTVSIPLNFKNIVTQTLTQEDLTQTQFDIAHDIEVKVTNKNFFTIMDSLVRALSSRAGDIDKFLYPGDRHFIDTNLVNYTTEFELERIKSFSAEFFNLMQVLGFPLDPNLPETAYIFHFKDRPERQDIKLVNGWIDSSIYGRIFFTQSFIEQCKLNGTFHDPRIFGYLVDYNRVIREAADYNIPINTFLSNNVKYPRVEEQFIPPPAQPDSTDPTLDPETIKQFKLKYNADVQNCITLKDLFKTLDDTLGFTAEVASYIPAGASFYNWYIGVTDTTEKPAPNENFQKAWNKIKNFESYTASLLQTASVIGSSPYESRKAIDQSQQTLLAGATDIGGAFTGSFIDGFFAQKGAGFFAENELYGFGVEIKEEDTQRIKPGQVGASGTQVALNILGILGSRINWQEVIFTRLYCWMKGSNPNAKEVAEIWSQVPAQAIDYLKYLRGVENRRGWKAVKFALDGFPWDFKISCDDGWTYFLKQLTLWMKRLRTGIAAINNGIIKLNETIDKLILSRSRNAWVEFEKVLFNTLAKVLYEVMFEFLEDVLTDSCDPPLDKSADDFADPFFAGGQPKSRFAAEEVLVGNQSQTGGGDAQNKLSEFINEIALGEDTEYVVDIVQLFLKDLRCILTPLESVYLLKGEPTQEIITIAKNLIKSKYSKPPEDLSYLLVGNALETFFKNLGGVVDKNLLDLIEDSYENLESKTNFSYEDFCKDNRIKLIEDLYNNKVPKELGILEQRTATRVIKAKKLIQKLADPYADININYLCQDEENPDADQFKNKFISQVADSSTSMFDSVLSTFNEESNKLADPFVEKKTYFRIDDEKRTQFGSVDYNLYNTNLQSNLADVQIRSPVETNVFRKIKYLLKSKQKIPQEQLFSLMIDVKQDKVDLPFCSGSKFQKDEQFFTFAEQERVVYIREIYNAFLPSTWNQVPWPNVGSKSKDFVLINNPSSDAIADGKRLFEYFKNNNPKFLKHLQDKISVLAVCAIDDWDKYSNQYTKSERKIFFRHLFYDEALGIIRVIYQAEYEAYTLSEMEDEQISKRSDEAKRKFVDTMDVYVGHMWSVRPDGSDTVEFRWAYDFGASIKRFDDLFRKNVKVLASNCDLDAWKYFTNPLVDLAIGASNFLISGPGLSIPTGIPNFYIPIPWIGYTIPDQTQSLFKFYGFTTQESSIYSTTDSVSWLWVVSQDVEKIFYDTAITDVNKKVYRNVSPMIYVLDDAFITEFVDDSTNYKKRGFDLSEFDQEFNFLNITSDEDKQQYFTNGNFPTENVYNFFGNKYVFEYPDKALAGNIVNNIFVTISEQLPKLAEYIRISTSLETFNENGIFNIDQVYDITQDLYFDKINVASSNASETQIEYKNYFSIKIPKLKDVNGLEGIILQKFLLANQIIITNHYKDIEDYLKRKNYLRVVSPPEFPIWEQYKFELSSDKQTLESFGINVDFFTNNTREAFKTNARLKYLNMIQRKEFYDRWLQEYNRFTLFNLANNAFYKNCKVIPHYLNYYIIEANAKNDAVRSLCDDNMRTVPISMISDILVHVTFRVYVVDVIVKMLPMLSLMNAEELNLLYEDQYIVDLVRETIKREMHQYTKNYQFDTPNDYYQSFVKQKVKPLYEKYENGESATSLKPRFISTDISDLEKEVNYFIRKEIKYAVDFIVKKEIIKIENAPGYYNSEFTRLLRVSTDINDIVQSASLDFEKIAKYLARCSFNTMLTYTVMSSTIDKEKKAIFAATKEEIANIFFSISTIDPNATQYEQTSANDILAKMQTLGFSENPALFTDMDDVNYWYYVKFFIEAVFNATHQITQVVAYNEDPVIRVVRVINELSAIINSTVWAVVDQEFKAKLKNDYIRDNNLLGYMYLKRTEEVKSPIFLPFLGSDPPMAIVGWVLQSFAGRLPTFVGLGYIALDLIKEFIWSINTITEFNDLQKLLLAQQVENCDDIAKQLVQVFPCNNETQKYILNDTKLLEEGLTTYDNIQDDTFRRDSEDNIIYEVLDSNGQPQLIRVAIAEAPYGYKTENFILSWGQASGEVPRAIEAVTGITYITQNDVDILNAFSKQKPRPREPFIYDRGNPIANRNGQLILLTVEPNPSTGLHDPIKYTTGEYYVIPIIPEKK